MVDIDTFLTILYVMVDDFCKSHLPPETRPGPKASLSRSEVITLAIFGQWQPFSCERDFYRYAQRHLRGAFPDLPHRVQFNRLLRRHGETITAFFLYLVEELRAQHCAYEALDTSAAPRRDAKRRGAGWLPGLADTGWSNRLGWYEGFHLLMAVNPVGVITGFGFGPASAKDQSLAETLFALRHQPTPDCEVWECQLSAPVWSTKASRANKHIGVGVSATEQSSSAPRNATVNVPGLSGCGAGWPAYAR